MGRRNFESELAGDIGGGQRVARHVEFQKSTNEAIVDKIFTSKATQREATRRLKS